MNMTLKLPLYFYPLMEKPLGGYFQVWSPYYQVGHCNQKTPIPILEGDRSVLRKPKKDKHQH